MGFGEPKRAARGLRGKQLDLAAAEQVVKVDGTELLTDDLHGHGRAGEDGGNAVAHKLLDLWVHCRRVFLVISNQGDEEGPWRTET